MKNMCYKLFAFTALITIFWACDSTKVDEVINSAPVIESFDPVNGYAGCEMTVFGESLHNVVAAKVGGADAQIVQRISDKKIIIKVPPMAVSGKIELTNAQGTGVSEDDFIMEYPAPSVKTGTVPDELEISSTLVLFGDHMGVITRVLFTVEGNDAHEAAITDQTDKEIVLIVPYVEAENAVMSFEYNNGEELTISNATIPVKVIRVEPVVSSISSTAATIGDEITLTGEHLEKINNVVIGDEECEILSKKTDELKFMVHELASFIDGDNSAPLNIVYFEGMETRTLEENFKVNVPFTLVWRDRTVWAQSRDAEQLVSFFSPLTGVAYANTRWRSLDPVSYSLQSTTCSAPQKPAVSAEEYFSVAPYFFFTGTNAGNLQINSPAGSSTLLKNFFTSSNASNSSRITGNNANCYGTPVLTFIAMSASTPSHAKLINLLKTTPEQFNAVNYPLDVSGKKCGDISLSSASNTLIDAQFAPGVFTAGKAQSSDLDSYIMVIYYDNNGLNTSNKARNVVRVGVLNIKHIDFKQPAESTNPSLSSVNFDMYWMKHDFNEAQ